ncbi:MAG: YcaO-like family protein [Betaproteobacteria bacterium]|jgi:ribosomal protein S12 methylthiotransferase accessory factor
MQRVDPIDRDASADGGSERLSQAIRRDRNSVNSHPRPKQLTPSKTATSVPRRNRMLNETQPRAVLLAIDDDSRICPIVTGPAVVNGGLLIVRTAQRDIEIRAPSSLLREATSRFDGTRSITEALAALPNLRRRDELRAFVAFLLEQGAMIDANLLTAEAARFGFQGSQFGLAAPARLTNQICRRFLWNSDGNGRQRHDERYRNVHSPLDRFFDRRVSTYTFEDGPVPVKTFEALLWSLAGVVRERHDRVGWVAPKRTIASAGGMHLLEVYAAIQRPIGKLAVGVYRVRYPSARTVTLDRVSNEHALLPRAFGNPWELRFAAGAIFLAADVSVASLRYRNRALQYLFMEAGAALHNGGLVAPALGLGYSTIGGYYESVIGRLCQLGKQLTLGSAIFGLSPSTESVRKMANAPEMDYAWVDTASPRYSMPFHLARARIRTADDNRPFTWGRGTDPWLALRKATAEAIEREGFREPRSLVKGTLDSVRGALDPRLFIQYSKAQYRHLAFPYRPFDPSAEYYWVKGRNLLTDKSVRVVADLVYARASLLSLGLEPGRPLTQVTSSGCAAGITDDEAVLRALLEIIERDAFMRHWLRQTPGHVLEARSLPIDLRRRISAIEATGCRVCVQRLESPWAHVALIAAQNTAEHFTTMGTASHSEMAVALVSALDELEARVYAWLHGHAPSISAPKQVQTTEHHFELYGLKRYFVRADTVLFPSKPSVARFATQPLGRAATDNLVARFSKAGIEPVAINITPRLRHVDQGRTPLSVFKALVPTLLPMSFGFMREPRGMLARVHPASNFPHPFP